MVWNWMRGPASMCSVGIAWLVSASYCMDSRDDLGLQPVLLLVSVRTPSSPCRTRVCVIGFHVWISQRRNLVAVSTRSLIHLQVAGQHRRCEMGAAAAIDFEADVDLLVAPGVSQSKPDWIWLRRGHCFPAGAAGRRSRVRSSLRRMAGRVRGWWRSRFGRRSADWRCRPSRRSPPMNQLFLVTNVMMTPSL